MKNDRLIPKLETKFARPNYIFFTFLPDFEIPCFSVSDECIN